MTNRLIELAVKRGRLQERIAGQRATLARQALPLVDALAMTDQVVVTGRRGLDYLRAHPGQLAGAVAVLAVLRPKRVWRWGQRAFVAWEIWRRVRGRLERAGLFGKQIGA